MDSQDRGYTDSVVLKMIVEDIRHIKDSQDRDQEENREEFRRVRDRIDILRDDVKKDLASHGNDIIRLETQATIAGRISGLIAGGISGLVVGVTVAIVKYLFFNG